uniref:J domain-containing protein n=1 Tax=Thermosporothrix sp. COM3 TaxID=2490863 RepID=A0A455SPT9_9CHLR|nr:hypothetical protein KTC_51480 [Thermosporothrix sp. COM3]
MALKDFYAILGVPRTATQEEIKLRYRTLVRQYHPDLNKEASDNRIKELNEAYDTLGNEAKRARYDIEFLEEMRYRLLREEIRRRKEAARNKQKMTWKQGFSGFFRELKKEMR